MVLKTNMSRINMSAGFYKIFIQSFLINIESTSHSPKHHMLQSVLLSYFI